MRKVLLYILMSLTSLSCFADMVCVENQTGESIRIKFQKGAYILYECIPNGLGTDSKLLKDEEVTLENGGQCLLETEYTFLDSSDLCGFFISGKGVVDIIDYNLEERRVDDFLVKVIENDASSPLDGKAFFSDRVYKITKAFSATPSPKDKHEDLESRKRSGSSPK